MPTKEEALSYVKAIAEQKIATKDEVKQAYDLGSGVKTDASLNKRAGIAEILYYIGGAIIFLGIAILLAQNWSTLSFATKVLATFGVGVAAYFTGVLFSKDKRTETAGHAFHLISALVLPIGIYVILDNSGIDAGSMGSQSFISGLLLSTYLLSYAFFRKNIFALFSILFGTWFFFSVTSYIIGGAPYFEGWEFSQYRVLIVGITYMLLGYSFSTTERSKLSGFLYGFGVLGFLTSALVLGEWKPHQNVIWELIYPGLVFGVLFISVYLKSKSFLTFGTIFLMAYILKITSEYFASGLGWPLSLVVAGLAMIGVGYMSLSLKKKYLNS